MTPVVTWVAAILAGLFAGLAARAHKKRVKLQRRMEESREFQRRMAMELCVLNGKLPRVSFPDISPAFKESSIGPTLESEVAFVGSGTNVYASVSDTEAWVLSVLSKGASRIFEFGTATGRTTYLFARNAAADATVITITLKADEVDSEYVFSEGDDERATEIAAIDSSFEHFLYTGTDSEQKVEQLYGDSKRFDESVYEGQMDLIFVDGSHAYSYVKSDSEKAFRMVKPGGFILWHDYRPDYQPTEDVLRYLDEIGEAKSLKHIQKTSLVIHQA